MTSPHQKERTKAFSQRILDGAGGEIRLIKGIERNRPCWFYLRLNPAQLTQYKLARVKPLMNIYDYGEILYCGWGGHPNGSAAEYMLIMYNYKTPG